MDAPTAFILGGYFGIAMTLLVIVVIYRDDLFPPSE